MADETPFQTLGPFFHRALAFDRGGTVARPGSAGRLIVIEGTLRDGEGAAVADALVESWQADAEGRYPQAAPSPAFDGFGRVATDAGGHFAIETVKPGTVPGPAGRPQAPHLVLGILARGILSRLVTRVYFADEPANEADPILQIVPPHRRQTLMAAPLAPGRYRFDVVLQGEGETVFFDI